MINWLELIFVMSVVSSIMFGAVLLIERFYKTEYIEYVYFMMKVVLIIFLIPMFILITKIVMDSMGYTINDIHGDDIMSVICFNRYNIAMFPHIQAAAICIFAIWGLGAILTFINSFIKGRRLLHHLIKSSETISKKELDCMIEKAKTELDIRKLPVLYKSHLISTPFLTGIFNPKIIFPGRDFSEEEWDLMLRHELMHLKSNDLLFKAIIGIVHCIHWFNPIVYLYKIIFFDFSEYACDKRTAAAFNSRQKSQYAGLIVSLAATRPEYEQTVTFVDRNYKVIERRVKEIMKKPTKEKSALLIGTMALFILLCPMAAYAAASGVMEAQSIMVKNELTKNIEESNIFLSQESSVNMRADAVKVILVNPRGINNIDMSLEAGNTYMFDTLSLKKGQEITLSIVSDKSSDRFSVSITDKSGKGRLFSSNKGMVSATYTVPQNGDYKIYMNGPNSGSDDIHISGTIRIE